MQSTCNRLNMLAAFCLTTVFTHASVLLNEDFSSVANPTNVTGSLPLNEWHMDGSTEWQKEGWYALSQDASVNIVNGSVLSNALQLGWAVDNVEVRCVLSNGWNFPQNYELIGEWEKTQDGDNHPGFYVYLSEFSADGFVQHVKQLHVDPGNPEVGTIGTFTLSVSALDVLNAYVNPSNYLGVVFVRSEDDLLMDENTTPDEWTVRSDKYIVDNLVLTESDPDLSSLSGIIMQPVYVAASGDNNNDGLSPDSPWLNVNALENRTFGPGAQILFRRGDEFIGACTLLGNGLPGEPILISSYGTGDKPLLTGKWDRKAVFFLTDNEGIEFRDLAISNYNTNNVTFRQRHGINLSPPVNSGEMSHIHFNGVEFRAIQGAGGNANPDYDHESSGIYAETVDNDDAELPSYWNGFVIENCTFADIDGRAVRFRDYCLDIADVRLRGYEKSCPTLGFVFQNNYGTNCYRNLLMFRGTRGAVVQYNVMDTTVEGSAVWPFAAEDTLIQFNEFRHLRAHDTDAYVCHFDYNCVNTLMQYNFGYDVEGGLIQVMENPDNELFFQEGAVARYNIGIDVGFRDSVNSAGIFINGPIEGAQVYNNTVITLFKSLYKAISFNDYYVGDEAYWPKNNEVRNNIFYARGTAAGFANTAMMSSGGNVISHNLYQGNMSVCPADSNPVNGLARFVDYAGLTAEDFRVKVTSDAIAAGYVMADNGSRDYFGNTVSSSAVPTIGFHEYQTDATIDSDGDLMVDMWETQSGLDPSDASDAETDLDGDRFPNLYEFSTGGNPVDSADIGYQPFYNIENDRFVYVYPRRADWQTIGLRYNLTTTTNLVEGPWIETAHQVDGVGDSAFGAGFDAVTNSLSLNGPSLQQFIRLDFSGQSD